MERQLNGIPDLHVMRSQSTFGLSLVSLVFEDGTEDYFVRQRIQERSTALRCRPGVQAGHGLDHPAHWRNLPVHGRIQIAQRAGIARLNNWVVIPRLIQVPGVIGVDPFGGENYQFQVFIDPDKLAQYNLALPAVEAAISANNINSGGSVIVRGEQSLVVRGAGAITKVEDLENIVITQKNGTPIFVKDIGHAEMGVLARQGILGKDDNDDAVSGIVQLLRGKTPPGCWTAVHRKVEELNTKLLPPDVKVVPYLGPDGLVKTTLHTVSRALLEGMALVLLVLMLFLGSVRGAAVVALTVPVSLLWAFVLMHYTKVPANLLSLGAIDFGIIVDGAIVLMEVILRRHEDHPDAGS